MLSGIETTAKKGANQTYRGGKKLAQTTARKVKEKREISRTLSESRNASNQTGEAAKSAASKIGRRIQWLRLSRESRRRR